MALERRIVDVVDAVDATLAAAVGGIRRLGRLRWRMLW
jgi:hypothetical protein